MGKRMDRLTNFAHWFLSLRGGTSSLIPQYVACVWKGGEGVICRQPIKWSFCGLLQTFLLSLLFPPSFSYCASLALLCPVLSSCSSAGCGEHPGVRNQQIVPVTAAVPPSLACLSLSPLGGFWSSRLLARHPTAEARRLAIGWSGGREGGGGRNHGL